MIDEITMFTLLSFKFIQRSFGKLFAAIWAIIQSFIIAGVFPGISEYLKQIHALLHCESI